MGVKALLKQGDSCTRAIVCLVAWERSNANKVLRGHAMASLAKECFSGQLAWVVRREIEYGDVPTEAGRPLIVTVSTLDLVLRTRFHLGGNTLCFLGESLIRRLMSLSGLHGLKLKLL